MRSTKLFFQNLLSSNKCQLAHSLPCPQWTTFLFIRLSAVPTSRDKKGHQFHQVYQVESSRCHQTTQMQAVAQAMAMVDMVSKPDVEVTMTMAVVNTWRLIQVRQNSRVHVRCSKGTSYIAQITCQKYMGILGQAMNGVKLWEKIFQGGIWNWDWGKQVVHDFGPDWWLIWLSESASAILYSMGKFGRDFSIISYGLPVRGIHMESKWVYTWLSMHVGNICGMSVWVQVEMYMCTLKHVWVHETSGRKLCVLSNYGEWA